MTLRGVEESSRDPQGMTSREMTSQEMTSRKMASGEMTSRGMRHVVQSLRGRIHSPESVGKDRPPPLPRFLSLPIAFSHPSSLFSLTPVVLASSRCILSLSFILYLPFFSLSFNNKAYINSNKEFLIKITKFNK